jgi:hypothetical protein
LEMNLRLQNDVSIAFVDLSLVGLVFRGLLDNLQLLHAPDLKAGLLTHALKAWVKDRGHPKWGLELC